MSRLAVYPGTFDPITNGHMDIVQRAMRLFDELIVLIASNVRKTPLFDLDERVRLATLSTSGLEGVRVETFDGLLAEYARSRGAAAIVRGLRAVKDFEYEFQMALMNKSLNPDVETVFFMPGENFTYVNSSIVREVARLGGDVSRYVAPGVSEALAARFDPTDRS